MKHFLIILIIYCFSLVSKAQRVEWHLSKIDYNHQLTSNVIVDIYNDDDKRLWMFGVDSINRLQKNDTSKFVKIFFCGIRKGSDVNLSQVAYDGNVASFVADISSFVTTILPHDKFTLVLTLPKFITDSAADTIYRTIYKNFWWLPENVYILRYAPPINDEVTNIIYYKEKVLALPYKD